MGPTGVPEEAGALVSVWVGVLVADASSVVSGSDSAVVLGVGVLDPLERLALVEVTLPSVKGWM
jgi:hypothetical protein